MKKLISIILVVLMITIFSACKLFENNENSTSWATEKACAEVKSDVYNTYGEIPRVSGNLIYANEPHYIIAVKYELPEFDWKGSAACHIYGYSESNCHLSGMTKEMAYNYDYKAHLDELKAMWALS